MSCSGRVLCSGLGKLQSKPVHMQDSSLKAANLTTEAPKAVNLSEVKATEASKAVNLSEVKATEASKAVDLSEVKVDIGSCTSPMSFADRNDAVNRSFSYGDTASLVKYHDQIDLDNVTMHEEADDGASGDYIKAFVFGGLDGIVSTFALVAGMGGAEIPLGKFIAIGLAKVLADAMSMGFGEFVSASAELEQTLKVKEREEWEVDNYPEGEVKEMCELYMKKGVGKEDALTLLTVMVKYKELFVEHMLAVEHGLLPPDDSDRWEPVKKGLVCFLAFAAFGLVPLAGFLVLYASGGSDSTELWRTVLVAYVLTAVMLFLMGFVKAHLTGSARIKSGIYMTINGTVAGGTAYLLGEMLTELF